MLITLIEPSNFRYIRINPATNHIHLRVSLIEGEDISTANTCKVDERLKVFFECDAVRELETYKSTLEFHISLLAEDNPLRHAKKARLEQINIYLAEVVALRKNYKDVVNQFLSKPCNLYSMQLRPRVQDPYSKVVNPVFTINRENDNQGKPLSHLYNEMQHAFSRLDLSRTDLTSKVLKDLPENATFDQIKQVLQQQCHEKFDKFGINIDFESYFRRSYGEENVKKQVNKAHVDEVMGFGFDTTPGEYVDALLDMCAPNLWGLVPGSPFYLGTSSDNAVTAERLSITTQFYLAIVNIHCRIHGISDKNFGIILDSNAQLSYQLVETVSQALTHGDDVEQAIIITFLNIHKKEFYLSRDLNINDQNTIQKKFDLTYRTITATKENQHKDDFMVLDREASGEYAPVETHEGVIYTDFSHIVPISAQNQLYFSEIRNEAIQRSTLTTPQDAPVITIDIEPVALMDKLSDVQWESLPKEVIDACRAHPAFQARQFLDDVAKGKQEEAHAILESSEDKQTLLRTSRKFTDYSGRIFDCTAYEYAYWAKDTHMQRMLERHMNNDTKAFMLEKIDAMEDKGLSYQQHGIHYQNAHYDMSFILKDLSLEEFIYLKAIIGQSSEKLNTASLENYKTISFTADEYQALRKILEAKASVWDWTLSCLGSFQWLAYLTYPGFLLVSCFITLPAKKILSQLKFDFHSLITALDSYVTNYGKWNYHHEEEAWMKVGQAQRDVPAHVAHEYCRPDRSFDPLPPFTEETLPRILTFKSWFPLSSSSSGLGFDFAVARLGAAGAPHRLRGRAPVGRADLAAVRHLDEVRIADLTQSRENLSLPASQLGLVH